jgi:tetratricopeptide (TPR) repeat protein
MERGQSYFTDGNYEKARVEFRNALQISPNDAEARFMNGRVAEQLKDFRTAAGMYQGTIDANAEHVGARANLGRLLVFAGAPARALEIIEPALAKHPEDASLLTVRGAARVQLKDKAGALADAERAVKNAPTDENAVALLASIYRQSGDIEHAAELIRGVLEKKPAAVDLRQVLASLYLSSGQPELAEEQMRKVIELRPQELPHRVQLALLYARQKKLTQAEAVMKDATTALANNNDAKLAYVDFLASQGTAARAEQALQQFIARDPRNYDLQLGLGALQQRAGQLDPAIATYNKVVQNDGDGPSALAARDRLAGIEVGRGRLDAALQLVAATLKKNPRDNDALILRGNIALERHDPKAAVADLRAVLRDQPGAVGVLRTLARAHLANGETALAEEALRQAMDGAPTDIGVRIEFAQLLMQTNRVEQAISLLEDGVKSAPTDIQAREALVRAYLLGKDFAAARTAAEDLKVAAPKLAIGSYLAGVIAQAQNRSDDAAAEYTHALELQPNAMDALAALTRVDLSRGQRDRAFARVRSAVSANPQSAPAQNLLGEMYLEAKNYEAAVAPLTAATKIAPQWWLPYRNLALAHLAHKDTNGAFAAYEAGVTATNREAALVTDLAALYERAGRIEDAIEQYQALHEQNPQLGLAANNLAMLLVTYRTDKPSLDRARTLTEPFANSPNAPLLDTHGWVMFKLGQYAEALPVLERARERSPDSKVIRYHLAMAQLKSGQRDKARENLETALTGKANFAGVDEARTTLASLGGHSG